MRKVFVAVLAASVLAIGAVSAEATVPAPAAQPTTADKNIVQTAVAAGQFKTLVMLAKRAGLAGALTGEKKLTVFAPTDAAFRKVPKATLNKLLRNRAQLRRVLLYHVVAGDVESGPGRSAPQRQDARRALRPHPGCRRQRLPQPLNESRQDRRRGLERDDPRGEQGPPSAGLVVGAWASAESRRAATRAARLAQRDSRP